MGRWEQATDQHAIPLISALVCTRNRGASVVNTILSILANDHPNFELVVIDQSTNDETQEAVSRFSDDCRFTYLKSSTVGKGCALNSGLRHIRADVVAITDDDCEVSRDWLTTFASIFAEYPSVAVGFCCVEAVEHDPNEGFVPDFVRSGDRLLTSIHEGRGLRGIGAGIAVRRSIMEKLGGFDPMLGPGSKFQSCDERDIAMRALLAHYHVYETSAVSVKHFGFRTRQQGRELSRRDFVGIGAAYSKFLRCGRKDVVYIPAYEFTKFALWPPIRDLLHFRVPRGMVRITAFVAGFVKGLRTPLDKMTMVFIDKGRTT